MSECVQTIQHRWNIFSKLIEYIMDNPALVSACNGSFFWLQNNALKNYVEITLKRVFGV